MLNARDAVWPSSCTPEIRRKLERAEVEREFSRWRSCPCCRTQGKAQWMEGYMLRDELGILRGKDNLSKWLRCLIRDKHEQGRNRTNPTSNCKKGASLIAICIANEDCPFLLHSTQLAKLSLSPSRTGSHVSIAVKLPTVRVLNWHSPKHYGT